MVVGLIPTGRIEFLIIPCSGKKIKRVELSYSTHNVMNIGRNGEERSDLTLGFLSNLLYTYKIQREAEKKSILLREEIFTTKYMIQAKRERIVETSNYV